jgi:hypothetical protein
VVPGFAVGGVFPEHAVEFAEKPVSSGSPQVIGAAVSKVEYTILPRMNRRIR